MIGADKEINNFSIFQAEVYLGSVELKLRLSLENIDVVAYCIIA